jgi:NADH-quinone oxidoreductase subunit G
VGALLSKDFLNKARAWELDRTPSICPNCTQGCNSILETRDNVVVRMRPRSNADVNQWYLCESGRLDYKWLNPSTRLEAPLVRHSDKLTAVDWEVAIRAAATMLGGARVVALVSPMLSNESLFLASRVVARTGGTGVFRVPTGPEVPLPGVPDLALRAERAANVRGAELLGFTKSNTPLDALHSGDVLLVVGETLTAADAAAVARASLVIIIAPTIPDDARSAAIALPSSTMGEEEGTFTNLRGRVQRYFQANAAPGMSRPAWWILGDLLTQLGERTNYFLASEAFAALAASHAEFAGMSYDTLGLKGQLMSGQPAAQEVAQ